MVFENVSMSRALNNEDILFEIFKFLSSRDRKNAKLVCKKWFTVSGYKKLVEMEAFYFSNFYGLPAVIKILKNGRPKTLNLKFEHRRFHSNSDSLWKRCGARIESLRLYRCMFCRGMLQQIFIHCVNLKEFQVEDCQFADFNHLGEYFRRKSLFQTKQKYVRDRMRTLMLISPHFLLKESDLLLIADAFPRLESLKINLTADCTEGNVTRNFCTLLRLLGTKLGRVKTVRVEFPNDFVGPVHYSGLGRFDLSGLKKVGTTLYPNVRDLDSISRFKFWTAFRINWIHHPTVDMAVLVRLLDQNPLLEEMALTWRLAFANSSSFPKIFAALVNSGLKLLHLDLDDEDWALTSSESFVSEMSSTLESLRKNCTVRTLHIAVTKSVEFSSLFLKYFSNIRDLFIKPWDPFVVFTSQKCLKSIEIAKSNFHSIKKNPSKLSVKSLEFMEIRWLDPSAFLMYRFSNLKFLCINESDFYLARKYKQNEAMFRALDLTNSKMEDERNDTDVFVDKFICSLMPTVCRDCPGLEGLELNCRGASFHAEVFAMFFQSCLGFRHLRHVSFICDLALVMKADLKRLLVKYFEPSPSIRAVWLEFEEFKLYFFYNVIKKKCQFFDQYSNLLPCTNRNSCFKTIWLNER